MKTKWKLIMTKTLKIIGFFLLYVALAALIYLIFYFNGYRTMDDIRTFIDGAGAWAWLIFSIVQIFSTVVLFIIPAQTTAFIMLGMALFSPFTAFVLVSVNTLIASVLNFSVGKLFGKVIVQRIIGEDTMRKYQEKLETKAKIYYPIMMLFPFFPDDEITMLAGLTSMSYGYFIPVTFILRSIGIGTYVFLGIAFDYSSFTIIHWYQFLVIIGLLLFVVFFLAHHLEKYLDRTPVKSWRLLKLMRNK
ncbi:MAG: TVP38/TMEM64 family protein [Bacilli bacterium]|jgi:uncharacterized membrane protein YdjX (TVP38/TMEM64 family)